MQKHLLVSSLLVFTIVTFLPLFGGVSIAHADGINVFPPPCAGVDWAGAPVPGRLATCGYYGIESTNFDGMDVLNSVAYVYRNQRLATSTSFQFFLATNPPKMGHDDIIAFAKSALPSIDGSLDPMSIFGMATVTIPVSEYGPDTPEQVREQVLLSSAEIQKGLMDFVVSKDDFLVNDFFPDNTDFPDIPPAGRTFIDGKFIELTSLVINPYVQTPVTNPIKQKDLFYNPLGIYKGNHIVLYKSKEIQTLDDGSKKTITFPLPNIEGVVPFSGNVSTAQAPVPATNTSASVPQSWWSSFWCFIKGIFGKSC